MDYLSVKILKQNYDGNVVAPMGCRAFLSPYKDKDGKDVLYGRFNMGVVSLNLPDAGLSAEGDLDKFWKILDERMELAKKALMIRYERLKTLTTTSSPIHWEHGGVTRLEKGELIAPLLEGGFATISLGYIGVNECVYALIGEHSVTEKGEKLAVEIVKKLREKVDSWKSETGLGFALYSSPSESYTGTALRATRKRFGIVEGVTDREFFTNSYHYPVFLEVDAFSKLKYESQFHSISSGGAISYVEIPNMTNNLDAVMTLIEYIYDNVQYAELNTKSDYCHVCGFDGEIVINDDGEWECPQCHNKDKDKMNVVRRTLIK